MKLVLQLLLEKIKIDVLRKIHENRSVRKNRIDEKTEKLVRSR